MRALDVGNHPAVAALDENEIQRDRAAVVVEGDRDIGLVELAAQDRDRDGADPPRRGLDQEVVRLMPWRNPCLPQTRIEELARGVGIARQPAGKIGRPVAVIGVDIPDQRFRRTESSPDGRKTETGNNNQYRCKDSRHRRPLYLRLSLSYCCAKLPLTPEA